MVASIAAIAVLIGALVLFLVLRKRKKASKVKGKYQLVISKHTYTLNVNQILDCNLRATTILYASIRW